jgi:hypothetical protein
MEQRFVDLAIVLEALFTQRGERGISLAIGTRGAQLLGTNCEERRKVHDLFRNLYDARSDIVHGGRIKEWQTKLDGQDVHRAEFLQDATRLCERAVIHMIKASARSDWRGIVLGR